MPCGAPSLSRTRLVRERLARRRSARGSAPRRARAASLTRCASTQRRKASSRAAAPSLCDCQRVVTDSRAVSCHEVFIPPGAHAAASTAGPSPRSWRTEPPVTRARRARWSSLDKVDGLCTRPCGSRRAARSLSAPRACRALLTPPPPPAPPAAQSTRKHGPVRLPAGGAAVAGLHRLCYQLDRPGRRHQAVWFAPPRHPFHRSSRSERATRWPRVRDVCSMRLRTAPPPPRACT